MIDRLTDHATRSVTIGGAHSGEAKFCYCLRLQQSIYCTSRLDRSNQLQQPAAIFSCKTRRVAVCGDTLQYSLEESVSDRRTRQVTVCVILFMLIFQCKYA